MQAAVGCHAPALPSPCCTRWRTYTPPCAPSTSDQHRPGSRLIARAGKDDKSKRSDDKADFSARWALRVKNFFSSRRNYLQQAEQADEQAAEKAYKAELAREEEKLRKLKEAEMSEREAKLRAMGVIDDDVREGFIGQDILKARLDLESSPLTKAALAVVRVRELLKALLLLPVTLASAVYQGWRGLFDTQRYENFLMSEGEAIWYWRNRMENERWFWEVFVWDRLLFPILAIVCYEYLVPNHFLWAVVVPVALLAWLTDRLPTPSTPEFWMIAFFGFYRKCWPGFSAWMAGNVLPLFTW